MTLYVSTGDGVGDYRTVYLYWGRCDREWGNTYLYWGRNGRVWCCISLLGTMLIRMTPYISAGDGVEGYVAVDLYWGRICRVVLFYMSTRNVEICSCRSPLGK